LSSLIINALTLNSLNKQGSTKEKVSHYFELNLKGVGFMDDSKWKHIMAKGYHQTHEYLESLPEEERFWEQN
jgi:NTE family protein